MSTDTDPIWFKSWPKGVPKHIEYPIISIHDNFDNIADNNPDLPYLSILGMDYSYKTVKDQSNSLAKSLQEHGVEKGERIGIFLPNLPQFTISFFGILKSGAQVVLISPLLGSHDLTEVLIDSEITTIIALDLLYPQLDKVLDQVPSIKRLIFTSLGDLLSPLKRFLATLIKKLPKSPKITRDHLKLYNLITKNPGTPKKVMIDPKKDIAAIAYTGGTTGVPKGAMISHYNIITNLKGGRTFSIQLVPKGEHVGFLGAVPFYHIIGLVGVMLFTAEFESTVYLVPDPRKFESILQLIDKNKISIMHGVPTLFRAILKVPNFDNYDVSSLKIILSGAAALPPDLAEEMEERFKTLIVEAYGMTETSPIISTNPFEQNNRKLGSIGIPYIDTKVEIRDSEIKKALPIGEIGEIVVHGNQIMKGYLNKPEETQKTIQDGWLYTGDMGYMDEDGFLFIVNRKKDMINASGYKVFPFELEKLAKENFPEIEETVVIGVEDPYRGETVKMLAILKEGYKIAKEEIISFYKRTVAKYKVPKVIEYVKEFPKTPIGKIDRKKLRESSSENSTSVT